MSDYFGHKPQDWERSMMQGMMQDPDTAKTMLDAIKNPEDYTTARPNMATDAAFNVGSMVGAGRDGLKKGPSTAYYKIEKSPEQQPAQQAPQTPQAEPEKAPFKTSYKLSNQVARANAGTAAYEQELLPNQGTAFISESDAPVQAYKDAFQKNLTEELKTKVPRALADKVTVIEQADATALLNNNFNLNLAQSGMQPGQAGRRGLSFN